MISSLANDNHFNDDLIVDLSIGIKKSENFILISSDGLLLIYR